MIELLKRHKKEERTWVKLSQHNKMFGEHEKYKIILSISLLDLLIEKEYEEITSDLIIEKAKFTKENYIWMADDKVSLLKTYFEIANNEIIIEANKDFKEDISATVNEKLTDIIIRFFEFHEKHKLSIKKLYRYNLSNSNFLSLFIYIISDLSKKSLKISGGQSLTFNDNLILIGLTSTYSLIFHKWIITQNKDISNIMNIADNYLNNAEEIASNLKIIK